MNENLSFPISEDRRRLEIHVEDVYAGDIVSGGTIVDIGNIGFTLDDLRTIITKALEVQKFGKRAPVCEICGGTPFFPNMRPADRVFEEHLCTAPLHTNGPR